MTKSAPSFLIITIVLTMMISGCFMQSRHTGQDVITRSKKCLQTNDYDGMQALAERYMSTDKYFENGSWKLDLFYKTIAYPDDGKSEEAWTRHIAFFEQWMAKSPDSQFAAVGKAAALDAHAWNARGGGYADTVKKTAWKTFYERQAEAKRILEECKARHPVEVLVPEWYDRMLNIMRSHDYNESAYNRLFDEATGMWPDYWTLYTNKAFTLLPRWHGEEGDWLRFADDMRIRHGNIAYLHICMYMTTIYGEQNIYSKQKAKWEYMKLGYEQLMEEYPKSTAVLNTYCRTACNAADRETAVRLFKIIDKKGVREEVWGDPSYEYYEKCRKWALGK